MVQTICWFLNSMEQEAQDLARGLQKRAPELLDRLIEQYQYRLVRYLLVLVGSQETAEDLFQETWIRVLENGRRYNAKWRFETWLFTIARNLAIDFLRQRKPQSLDALLAPDGSVRTFELPDPKSSTPFDQVAQGEDADRLRGALTYLPPSYREVLMLRFQEDLELSEIAAIVASPVPTVKSRLYRGLETLREALKEDQRDR